MRVSSSRTTGSHFLCLLRLFPPSSFPAQAQPNFDEVRQPHNCFSVTGSVLIPLLLIFRSGTQTKEFHRTVRLSFSQLSGSFQQRTWMDPTVLLVPPLALGFLRAPDPVSSMEGPPLRFSPPPAGPARFFATAAFSSAAGLDGFSSCSCSRVSKSSRCRRLFWRAGVCGGSGPDRPTRSSIHLD